MIIADIVAQHAEELAFIWLLRDNAIRAPHYDLKDLADCEERIEAHLDGLRVAGEEAWPFCIELMAQEEIGEAFAVGIFALDDGREEWVSEALALVASVPETSRGFLSALGWVEPSRLRGRVANWLRSESATHRYLGIGACAVHRQDCGEFLQAAIEDGDARVRARGLRAVGELRRYDLGPAIQACIEAEDIACRYWAARSAALLGNAKAVENLTEFVDPNEPLSEAALSLAVRAMEPIAAVQWVRKLNRDPGMARLVVQATGVVGDPVSVPWLIAKMANPELARVAGESFSTITGVDLAYVDLEADWPEGFEAGPTENPEDEDVAMDPDEDLPWPDPELIEKWWSANHQRFPPGRRYLCGQPISRETCIDVLRNGMQRQRRAAALELALLSPNEMLFNTSAPAKRQAQVLAAL